MKHLATYIERKNAMAAFFKEPLLNIRNLDQAAAQRLWEELESNLSPENLTCDGELDAATVRERRALYKGAQKDLAAKFSIKEVDYGY